MQNDTEVVGTVKPILASAYPYTGNGLGGLSDAIECIITHEINGQYELYMRYPITGIHYEELSNGKIIMGKPDAFTDEQPFRIYRITKPLNGVVTVYARHLCYDLQGIVVEPFTAGSLTEAMLTIPTKCTPSSPITLQTTRTVASGITLNEPRPLWRLLGGQEGSLLDVYGGEWDFDKLDAKLVTQLGQDRGVNIRYGKNLTELEQDATIEASYSGVFPYWYDEESSTLVTLTEKVVAVTGSVVTDRNLVLDCSDDFDTQPTEQQLRDRANAYIAANSVGNMKASWKVSFVDTDDFIDQVALGDTLHVYYAALDVNATARAVKTEYDVLKGKYKSITVGRVKQNLAAIIVNDKKETDEKIKTTKSFLEHAIDDATYSITHGDGTFRFIYDGNNIKEIVSLDDPDITQAHSVWRWNDGGFGHSSNGYNGQYTLALLPDGSINAAMITTNILNANVIRAGVLQDALGKNSWDLSTGAFTITDGTINITTSNAVRDQIRLNWNDWNANNVETQIWSGGVSVTDHNSTYKRWFDMNRWGYYEYQDNANGTNSYAISWLANATLTLGSSAAGAADGVGVAGDIWIRGNDGKNRTHINDTALTFYDSSGTQTAEYPATGLKYQNLVLNGNFNSSSYNLDNATETGMYTYTSAANNTPLNAGGMLLVAKNSSSFITQLAFSNYSTASGNYLYTRRYYNGTWTAWTRIIN